jgi:hypothetical protein
LRGLLRLPANGAGSTIEARVCFLSFGLRPKSKHPLARVTVERSHIFSMLRIPKGPAPWLTARYLFLNNLPLVSGTARLPDCLASLLPFQVCIFPVGAAFQPRRSGLNSKHKKQAL